MQRIIPILALIAGLIYLTSCEPVTEEQYYADQELRFFGIYMGANYPEALPEASGLYYVENKEGNGDTPVDSSWILINHVAYTIPGDDVIETYIENVAKDNRFEDTTLLYGPYKLRNGYTNPGFTEGLNMMQEGGEATFLFTSELGYGPTKNAKVGAFQSLKYEVQLLEVLGVDIVAYEAEKIIAYTDTIVGVDTVYDANNDVAMYYIVDEPTDGPPVAIDSTIEVGYKGYLTDGRVFDVSPEDTYFKFKVGDYEAEQTAITGWHLGLAKFKEGEKGRLIIPYPLAYGEAGKFTKQGNVSIPAYETLVFDVVVFSVDPEDIIVDPH